MVLCAISGARKPRTRRIKLLNFSWSHWIQRFCSSYFWQCVQWLRSAAWSCRLEKFVFLRDKLRVLRTWCLLAFNGVGRMDAKTKFSLIWLLASKSRTRKDNFEDHGPLVPLAVTRRYHLKSFSFECCFGNGNQDYMAFNFCLQTKGSNFDVFTKTTLTAFDKQECICTKLPDRLIQRTHCDV